MEPPWKSFRVTLCIRPQSRWPPVLSPARDVTCDVLLPRMLRIPRALPGAADMAKVLRYEAFVTDILRRDLRSVLESRDTVYEKIAQYLQLKSVIERLQESDSEPLHTQVDLGCNFYVSAE
ncbi:hypothetical protein FKM82_026939, partial [Ascaphus truei]